MEENNNDIKPLAKEETITIPKAQLDKFLDKMDDLEKKNEILFSIADKGKLSAYFNANPSERTEKVKLSTLFVDGKQKIIVAWRTLENIVFQDSLTMNWHERQKIQVIFSDNTTLDIDYMDFAKKIEKILVEVISETTDKRGYNVLKVATPEGEINIDSTFVN